MNPLVVIILSVIAGVLGFFLGILIYDIGSGIVACVIIAVGACVIHTINKSAERLPSDQKQNETK